MTNLEELDKRSREVFRHLVEAYVETGEPIGSKNLSNRLEMGISSATIRNIMADLESAGFLYAPHTSAGRLPTEAGLRLFVHGLLEIGALSPQEEQELTKHCKAQGKSLALLLEDATKALSGLSRCAGIVIAPKSEARLKHIEFVSLNAERVLVVLITDDGLIENRVIETPPGLPPSSLVEASNYLNSRLVGKTLTEAKAQILGERDENKSQLDLLTTKVVEEGLAIWAGEGASTSLIVRGQSHLLQDVRHMEEFNHIRSLFEALDTQDELLKLLDASMAAEGVQIFIGSENSLFKLSGCSLIISPYSKENGKVIGAIGVVGPSRLNYSRIISMVDYTAKLISRTIGNA